MPSLAHVIVWIIVGLLGGSLAGLMITRGIRHSPQSQYRSGRRSRRRPIVPHARDFPRPRQGCNLATGCRRRSYRIIARPCGDRVYQRFGRPPRPPRGRGSA